jgi:Protein of unknown function (DUF3105)
LSKASRRASRAAQRNLGRAAAAGGPSETRTTAPTGSQTAPGTTPGGDATTARPAGSRAGRREHPRRYPQRSFTERYRGPLLTVAAIAAIAVVGVFILFSATAKTYTCSQLWDPAPTASPAPGASAQLGYVQPDMGASHNVSQPQTYTYCPPASGTHINQAGLGPISGRVYGPDDFAQPPGWIHNLEHGARVLLYKCPGAACEDPGQAQLKALFQSLPNPSGCATVFARFDDMKWPYAAIVWDRVLPLETLDTAKITAFFREWAGRTNSEQSFCPPPSPSPAPSGSAAVGASPATGSPAASGAAASPSAS